MLHRSLLSHRNASLSTNRRVNNPSVCKAQLRDDVMGAVRKLQRQQQAPDRKEVWEADIKTAESKLFRYANKPRALRSPYVAIPNDAVERLFPGRASRQPITAPLCVSVDGKEGEDVGQVELKPFRGTQAWRICGLSPVVSKMPGLVLEGWKVDEQGKLVAMMRSTNVQVPVTPQNLLQQAQHHVQAGAAAVVAAARNVMDQKRTYVPARVRPISNEVFVPFGLWKELFDGTGRPFPASGLPLRVSVTGAVQMAEQPALLVRRITPYGYYVLRGIKGMSRVKGMLLVRWSLLVNGVVEMEVVERAEGEGGAGSGTGSAVAPTQSAAAAAAMRLQQMMASSACSKLGAGNTCSKQQIELLM